MDMWVEDGIHHHLEGGWRVHESKEHHKGFKKPFGCQKRSFPLVFFLNLDVIVAPSYVKLCKQSTAS